MKLRLLALSWTMPPLVFPRSLQISRALRALSQRGCETTVVTITPEAEHFATRDPALEDFYKDGYRRIFVELREEIEPNPLWLRAWRKLRPPPDQRVDNWVRRAGGVLRREIASGAYDALITFAQPWIDHTLGLQMKRQFPNLPWIAHFSDPWVDSAYRHFANDAEREAAFRHEREIIAAADTVIFINQYTADLVMAKYPAEWRAKVRVIPHGFEPDLLDLLQPPPTRAPAMRIVHTGNFYGHRKPDLVLRAARQLSDRLGAEARLEFVFVGHADDALRQTATDIGVDDIVTFTGPRSYLESLETARSADLLLLIDAPADTSVFLPSKIVDYFMLERPILGLTPERGASAEALRKVGCTIVDPADYEGILAALTEAFENWRAQRPALPAPLRSAASEFEIDTVAGQFEAAIMSARSALGLKPPAGEPPMLLSLAGVNDILDQRAGSRQLTLVLWNADTELAEALLARPDVRSVILSGPNPELLAKYPDRCGWWYPDTADLVPPALLASEMHYFVPGGQWPFGVENTRRFFARKVWQVHLHDIDFGSVRTNMGVLLANALRRSLRFRISRTTIGRLLDRSISWRSSNTIRRNIGARIMSGHAVPGRIMLVTGSLGSGGSERQTVNTLLGLKAAGSRDLSLLLAHPLVPPHDFFHPVVAGAGIACIDIEKGVAHGHSHRLPSNERAVLLAVSRLGMRRDLVLRYLRIFRQQRPEIVHTWLDDINVYAGIAAVLAGVPRIVIGCRSLAPDHFPFHQIYMRPIYRILARRPNVTVLNNSAAGARDYVRWAGIAPRIKVIRNGFSFAPEPADKTEVATTLRALSGADDGAQLVGTIMRLSAEKQPHLWLDIAEKVGAARPDTHFIVIGDGPLMAELSARIAASPLAGRVSLLGRRHDAAQLLAGLDAFVLTSSVEGLPNVVVEAQSEGVPVVAADVGGVGEVFEDGDTGILVQGAGADAFAAGVLQVLGDPDMRQRARDTAPALMRKRFSVARMIGETLDAYGRNR